jgi:hypothetical protein
VKGQQNKISFLHLFIYKNPSLVNLDGYGVDSMISLLAKLQGASYIG